MATVRVSDTVSVQHPDPDIVEMVVLREGQPFDTSDPFVEAYAWAFESDGIEEATAKPGQKRTAAKRG